MTLWQRAGWALSSCPTPKFWAVRKVLQKIFSLEILREENAKFEAENPFLKKTKNKVEILSTHLFCPKFAVPVYQKSSKICTVEKLQLPIRSTFLTRK